MEFGVESGLEGNSVYLADVAGWSGLFMEADDGCFKQLQRKYIAREGCRRSRRWSRRRTSKRCFEAAGVPLEPDVMSIDVDGQDYWIWEGISRYRPRLCSSSTTAAIDVRRRLVQPRGSERVGSHLLLRRVAGQSDPAGEPKGYRLVHTELSAINAFFVREDLAEGAFPAAAEVPIRAVPNFFGRGHHHRPPAGPPLSRSR